MKKFEKAVRDIRASAYFRRFGIQPRNSEGVKEPDPLLLQKIEKLDLTKFNSKSVSVKDMQLRVSFISALNFSRILSFDLLQFRSNCQSFNGR
jgi:hypothetical protein